MNTTDSAPSDGWNSTGEFTGLSEYTQYYFFARLAENTNHNASPASNSTGIYTADITKPTGNISIETNNWDNFWNTITFGLFFNDTQTVTVTGADNSGTVTIQCYLSAEVLTESDLDALTTEWQNYSTQFSINPNNKYIVYVKLSDPSDNVTYLRSNGIVVCDCGEESDCCVLLLGHTAPTGVWTSGNPATCTKASSRIEICARDGCGHVIAVENQAALGHDWTAWVETTPATCTAGNTEKRTCQRDCGVAPETRSTVNALGHTWVDADCTTPKTCSVCKETEGAALGHDWSDWVVTIKPTTTTEGVETRICKRDCGVAPETRSIEKLTENTYKITEGKNGSWQKGSGEDMTITSDGEYAKFNGVKVNGKNLKKKYYTAKAGSTIVALKAGYLEKLPVGTHNIELMFEDGNAKTKLTILSEDKPDKPTPTPSNPGDGKDKPPTTGDNSNMTLWLLLMAASVFGLGGTIIAGRKRRYKSK